MFELKPCPFCGGEALLEESRARKGFEACVSCTGCLVMMPTITFDTQEDANEKAMRAWNRRIGDDLLERMVDDGK